MKSLNAAYRLAALISVAAVFVLVGVSYRAFVNWRAAENMAARTAGMVKRSMELMLLAGEEPIGARNLQQWQRSIEHIRQDIDAVAAAEELNETLLISRLLDWSNEAYTLLREAESAEAHHLYRTSLSTVLTNFVSAVRVLDLEFAVTRRNAAMYHMVVVLAFSSATILVLVVLAGLYLRRRVLRALNALRSDLLAYGAGDVAAQARFYDVLELDQLAEGFNSTADKAQELTESLRNEVIVRAQAEAVAVQRLEENEVLMKETLHRIKNNFAVVESLLSVQASLASSAETVSALDDARVRITSMRMLYEKLLRSEQPGRISAREYLGSLGTSTVQAYAGSLRFQYHADIQDIELDTRTSFPLGAILTELLTNSMKYAYAPGEGGPLSVVLVCAAGGAEAVLEVHDNGKGLPDGLDPYSTESFGLMLVRLMAEQIGGSFCMESQPGRGTRSTVRFPHTDACIS